MVELLLTAAACGAIYLAFALLALSQEQHWSAVVGVPPLPPPSATNLRRRRWLAAACLALAGALCLLGHGASFGMLLWVLLLGAGAMAVSFTLSWKPRCLRAIALGLARGEARRPVR